MRLMKQSQHQWQNLGLHVFPILLHLKTFRPDVTNAASTESSVTSAMVSLKMSRSTVKAGIFLFFAKELP